MNDYDKGKHAGYWGISTRQPKSFAEAMGESAGRLERERQRRPPPTKMPQGESIIPRRAIYAGAVALLVLPFVFGTIWATTLLWSPGLRVVVIALSLIALLLSPLAKRLIGSGIGIYVGLFLGLGVAAIENIANNRPVTLANLNFITFIFVMLGSLVTATLALRKKRREIGKP